MAAYGAGELAEKSPAAPVRNPICYIHGMMQDKDPQVAVSPASDKGFKLLQYNVRLRWEVRDEKICEAVVKEYCRQRNGDGFIPKDLHATFKKPQDLKPTHFYLVTPACNVLVDAKAEEASKK